MINLTTDGSSKDFSNVADLIFDDLTQIESVRWEEPQKVLPPSKQADVPPVKVPPVLKLAESRVLDLIAEKPVLPRRAPKLIDLPVVEKTGNKPIENDILEPTTKVHNQVEQMPAFISCLEFSDEQSRRSCTEEKLLSFIYQNLKYPELARQSGISGTVVAQIVIDAKGTLKDLKLLREIGGGCDQAVVQVLNVMAKDSAMQWQAGQQNGKAVSVVYRIPVRFQMQ